MTKESIIEPLELAFENNKSETKEELSGIKIVILQRGWIVIGRYQEKGEYGVLTDAHVIRHWGTTEGLGQLALEGKQSETKLEKTGIIRFHQLTMVGMIDCDEKKWNKEL